jgi:hypothetical protein
MSCSVFVRLAESNLASKLSRSVLRVAMLTVVVGASAFSVSRAEPLDRRANVTFYEPVELPGVALEPGTYEFRMAEPNITQVFTKEGQLVGTFLTESTESLHPADAAQFTLEERPGDGKMAVTKWMNAGDTRGIRFIYHNW